MEALKEKFARAAGVVLTEYKGLTVEQMTDLRGALREADVEYRVVKNTLARIASDGTSLEHVRENFTGPVGVALTYGDVALMTKSVLEYAKKNGTFKVTCGVIEGRPVSEAELQQIAALPPREVLLGVMAGTFQAPAAKLARLLEATVVRLGYALGALKEQKSAG